MLWLDARRPASNHMLRHEVELAQLLPLSGLGTADPAGAVAVDSRFSVLENFVRFRCATERAATLEGAVSQLLVALQPSVHSGLSAFLFSAGQYACLSRWVSVTLLAPYDVVATVGEDAYAASAELLAAMARFGGRSMQLTAELYELLRMQWYALRTQSTDASVTRSATRLERAVAAKATELMACAQEVAVVALDFTCNRAVSATPSPVPSPARALASVDMGVGVEASAQRLVDEAVALLLEQGRLVALHGASTARQETIAQRLHFDGLLALASALLSLNSQASGSSTTRTHPLQAFRGEDNRAVALLSDHCGGLCEVLGRVGLQDVLEIVDRALPLLPRAFGAALAHDGARQLAAAVAQSLDAFPTEASLKLREEAYTLLAELHSAWSRAFEYALLHGGRYGDALDALMRVAELEEQRLVDAAALSPAAMTWRDALRALVAQACEAGCLGWLCSIPEQQLEGFAKQGVSLGEAISATLEMLAATLDPPSASSVAVNYYECLLVFQFSRRDFHEGARAMYTLCSRSESRESAASRAASSAAAVEQQARCVHSHPLYYLLLLALTH